MRTIKYILTTILGIFYIPLIQAESWELNINVENIYNTSIPGDWITLGTCDGCNDNFQYSEDEFDTPDGPIDYTDIQFTNYNWIGAIDSNGIVCEYAHFASDRKAIHPPSDLLVWNITGVCADAVDETTQTTQLNWVVDSLDQDYEIYIYVGEQGVNMRYTTGVNVNCNEMGSNYELIDGEWITTTNVKILMGGCASTGLQTFYWDADGDGLGSNLFGEYCNGFEPDGWVNNNDDVDDETYCESNNFDSCWICDGENSQMDCNQVCSPFTPVGELHANEGLIYGAYIDDCGICSEGGTNHIANSDQDCNGDCFGEAFTDDCGVCSEGNSGHTENSDQDCAGICFGNGFYDSCDVCNGYNLSCLDQIFGYGPTDFYAQLDTDLNQIELTWSYNNIHPEVMGYRIWDYSNDSYNMIEQIDSTDIFTFTIDGTTVDTLCINVFDQYDNQSEKKCTQSSEFDNFIFEFNDGSGSYLMSFPYLSNDDNSLETIFHPIEEYVSGVISEGSAAIFNSNLGWIGALSNSGIERTKAYWLKVDIEDDDIDFTLSVSGLPTDPNTIYNLHEFANLISYVGPDSMLVPDALPDEVEEHVQGIITQGRAAQFNPTLGWVGSLNQFYIGEGYWIKIDEGIDIDMSWNSDNSSSRNNLNTQSPNYENPFKFNQSMYQSFYFIDEIKANTFILDENDIIVSYCNDVIVGSRYYSGVHTDVPAMGRNTDNPEYCDENSTPNFKIYDFETDRLIEMISIDIPNWENLGINNISLIELNSEYTPDSSDIINIYPNPFNPSTQVKFRLEQSQNIKISIFNAKGELIDVISNKKYEAGYHSINWTPNNVSSGLYIISIKTNDSIHNHKALFLK